MIRDRLADFPPAGVDESPARFSSLMLYLYWATHGPGPVMA